VEHGKNGFVIPVKDPDALAAALTTLVRDPELRKRMGDYALQLAARKYSWGDIAQRTIDLYRTFI
jgi:glycosyltransferase involved in cell wall biosynthesis